MSKILIKILLVTLALLSLGLVITGCSDNRQTVASVGSKAPDFSLLNLDGESVSLSDFEGRPMFINFWRINCAPCREEMPHLQAMYEERQGSELVVLNINTGDDASSIEQFLQINGFSLSVLLDTDIVVARRYAIPGTPTAFFIDKEGIIKAKVIGPFPSKTAIDSRLSEITP